MKLDTGISSFKQTVAAATQQQALSAQLFLSRHVLIVLPWQDDLVRPKRPARLPAAQELPGQAVSTTVICFHVLNRGGRGVVGLSDRLVC